MRMKKYLIAAAMVVAVSGTFVSCHDDEIANSTVEQKIQAFEDVFTRAFGKPDPNHSWGFGDPIVVEGNVTRAVIDANGNMWEDCPSVGPNERDSVFTYVNALTTTAKVLPTNLSTYYVTHIYTGTDKHGSSNYENSNMNELKFAKTAPASITWDGYLQGEWFHIYDFNAAVSNDFEGNMLVVNTPPLNFAYHNSSDSKWHDKWIGVDGADINPAYSDYYYICFDFEAMPNEIYTIFERSDGSKAYVPGRWPDATGQDLIDAGITEVYDGSEGQKTYTVEADWKEVQVFNEHLYAPGNDNYTDWIIRLTKAKGSRLTVPKVMVTSSSSETIERVIHTGEQVVQSGRVFCEDIVSANYKFEDLDYNDVVFDAAIVHKYRKLVKTYVDNIGNPILIDGKPKVEVEYDLSDIEGEENGYSEYYAKVCLLAAGGTLPIAIKIGYDINEEDKHVYINEDVHNILGGSSPSIMINTLTQNEREKVNMAEVASYRPAVNLTYKNTDNVITDKFYGITDIDRDIKLYVQYGNVAAGISSKYYDGQDNCVASAKFMVPLGTPWAKERTNIATAYPQFTDWVRKETDENGYIQHPFWEFSPDDENIYIDNQLDGENKEFYKQGLDPEVWSKGNFINGTDYSRSSETTTKLSPILGLSEVDPVNPVLLSPTGTVLYNFYPETASAPTPGYLYEGHNVTAESSNKVVKGSTIRVYGVSISDMEVKCEGINENTFNSFTDGVGYIDIPVTKSLSFDRLMYDLTFSGKNFTITYVTLIPAGGGEGPLWEGSRALEYNTAITIEKSKFTNATKTSKIKFTATHNGGYAQIHIKKKIDQNNVQDIVQVYGDNGWSGSTTFTIGDYLSVLQSNDICIQGGGLTLTKVELIP